jgi:hypothetical protein
MTHTHLSADEQQIFKRLKSCLGAQGILFPETVKQVEAFEELMTHEKLTLHLIPDPDLILDGDYKNTLMAYPRHEAHEDAAEASIRAAARNGKEIPEEVRRRMEEDRG